MLTYKQRPKRDILLNKKVRPRPKLSNPVVMKTKYAISKVKRVEESSRKCGKCRKVGHIIRICPILRNAST